MASEQMLSVAEVVELPPGDKENATWINPGFRGVVRKMEAKTTQTGKKFFPCIIADTTGSATISVSFFTAPKFQQGDLIELSGQGLRRTQYKDTAQAAIGEKTEVHVIGASVHHEEQTQRAATGAPALNGTLQPVNGQTVGMAMKEALGLITSDPGGFDIHAPAFWSEVHTVASDIIRLSRLLEMGKLAPPIRERTSGHKEGIEAAAEVATVMPPKKLPPSERQMANLADGPEEDVPF